MRDRILACALTVCCLLAARGARAGGLEYQGQGAEALARGGAVTARADDPMVIAHNPAGLVELRGSQFLLNLNLALLDACVTPSGYYGWGTYLGGKASRLPDPEGGPARDLQLKAINNTAMPPVAVEEAYYTDPYDKVCLDERITPIPQIAWTRRISERVGIGFGFIFPSVAPAGRWGGENGVIRGDTGELRPAATRYMLLDSNNLGLFPNIAAAYRITDFLRVGFAFEWGLIAVNNYTMAAAVGGDIPANDIIAHTKAQDWFIPAFTASVHVVPVDSVDAVVAFRYQDDIKAKGDLDLTSGVFDPTLNPHTTNHIPLLSLTQAMPWKLSAGVRYASRFAPRPKGTGRDEADASSPDAVHDAMQDEHWDLELDVEYQMNDRNDAQRLVYKQSQVVFENAMTGALSMTDAPKGTTIQKHWQNQFVGKLGGTYNVVPGLFSVSAGLHHETRGVDPDYMQIDFWPVARTGLHAGVTLRVAKGIDFLVSYGHIFQETIVVAPPPHKDRTAIDMELAANGGSPQNMDKTVGALIDRAGTGQMVLEERPQGAKDGTARLSEIVSKSAAGQPPTIINAGTYSSNFDLLAVGVNVHF